MGVAAGAAPPNEPEEGAAAGAALPNEKPGEGVAAGAALAGGPLSPAGASALG